MRKVNVDDSNKSDISTDNGDDDAIDGDASVKPK